MPFVQIEHPVHNYDVWKEAFDSDPVGRQLSGVIQYRVLRPVDDPNYVIVELEFSTTDSAQLFLGKMHDLWRNVEGKIIEKPRARIVESVEAKRY